MLIIGWVEQSFSVCALSRVFKSYIYTQCSVISHMHVQLILVSDWRANIGSFSFWFSAFDTNDLAPTQCQVRNSILHIQCHFVPTHTSTHIQCQVGYQASKSSNTLLSFGSHQRSQMEWSQGMKYASTPLDNLTNRRGPFHLGPDMLFYGLDASALDTDINFEVTSWQK